MLENSWKFIVDYFKNNAANTGASETASGRAAEVGYRNPGSFSSYIARDKAASDSRISRWAR